MLIKIHGFPKKTKYQDVKVLVRSQCTITDFKLDNLGVDSHGNKNVLVTVRNEAEALCLVKCLNGYQITNECMLRVEGPEKLNVVNEGHDNMYEQRSGGNYQNPPRNEYSNQSSGTYNRGPPSYASSGPLNVPTPRVMEPQPARPEVWNSSNVSGNQWSNSPSNLQGPPNTTFPGTPIYPQHPSIPQRMDNNSYNENRPQQSSNYGYPPKNTAPDSGHQHYRSNDLRYMEVADGVPSQVLTHPGRHQQSFQQEKPITIMKDNFQGPTMYQIGSGNSGPYQGTTPQSGNPAWNQGQQSKHQAYAKLSPMQFDKYDDDRRHPQMDKRVDVVKSAQEGGRVSYKDYEKGRQYSPPRRIDHAMSGEVKKRISPPGHGAPLNREVMSRRLVSPERKISPMGIPTHRNISPPPRRPSPPSRWIPVTRPVQSPSERRVSPPGRRVSPPIRRESSPGRRFSAPGRRVSPRKRAMSPDAHVSPLGRRVSPSGRRLPERHPSPQAGRRMSPPHKRVSPTGRRVPSTERRLSPNGRHMVERRVSPRRLAMKRSSPSRRLESPPHNNTRPPQRYSPRRHHEKMADPKMDMDALKGKQVRPAYESQASSQAMYSGGYRPNPKETIPYGMSGARQPDQNVSSWQQERDKDAYASMKKQPEERRDVMEKRHPMRQSRSPLHRDRSPVTDRFRTNSPVSHSPRRSWALEKRPYGRSPEIREAPPPPIWPGKISRDSDPYKNKYNRVEDAPKQPPVWDRPAMPMEDKKRLDDVRRSGEDKRVGGAPPRMDPAGTYSQTQTDSKFTPREYVDTRKDEYHQRPREVGRRPSPVDVRKDVYERQRDVARRPSPERREFREGRPPHQQEERRHHDYRRQPSPRRDEPKKTEFEKDFEDIYKRTQEFKKKAEQMRRFDDRRRDTHSEERHRDVPKEDKYDRRRERSPQLRGDMDRHMRAEHERRRYEDVKHKEREPEWKLQDSISRKPILSPETKMKREKAADEILVKIINKRKEIAELREEQRRYVAEELRSVLQRMFMDMFGDQDVSFIEIVIRYQTKISDKAEEAMLRDILQNMPASYRATKRVGPEPEVPAKMARYSPETAMKEDYTDNNQTDTYVRNPPWSPPKEKPHWDNRHEMEHRHVVDNRPKFEHNPRFEQRPKKFIKPKPELKMNSQRNLTVIVPTKSPVVPKPKVKPKPAEIKPKVVQPERSSKAHEEEPDIKERAKQHDAEAPKQTVAQEPSSDGNPTDMASRDSYYELSPLMSKMLHSELQDIMIKVWQELPDEPTIEAEKVVVNRLRNKAEDDLRNVFGLNVSKRLLNVYNPLHIKMKFTSKPDGPELTRFLKRNEITNFKWNTLRPLTYTGIVQDVKNFDRLCSIQTFPIGKVKLIITSLYQFTKCPSRLRTNYHVDNIRTMSGNADIISEDHLSENTQNNDQTKTTTKPKEVVVEKTPSNIIKETAKSDQNVAKDVKEVAKNANTTEKQSNITVEKKVANTKAETLEKQNKATEKKVENKALVKKEPVKKVPLAKKVVDKKPKASGRSILESGNDFDELNDDEIMALVSEGIILDECSGSDEE